MELALLGAVNAVLLVLALVAFKLIRSNGAKRRNDDLVSRASAEAEVPADDEADTDHDDTVDVASRLGAVTPPPMPELDRNVGSVHGRPLSGLRRSAIVIDSSMNGSGPTPSDLFFSVVEALGGIGFGLTSDSAVHGTLADTDGNTASVELTERSNGITRIAIDVDSPRAVEALAVLEIWHRSRLGATDLVRLSARIR